jgi:hypothetical protein
VSVSVGMMCIVTLSAFLRSVSRRGLPLLLGFGGCICSAADPQTIIQDPEQVKSPQPATPPKRGEHEGRQPPAPDFILARVPRFGTRGLRIPKPDDVRRIVAELYQHPFQLGEVAPFAVPYDAYRGVLAAFEPAEIDPEPYPEMIEIGTLRIDEKNGAVHRLCIFWWIPGSSLYFSLDGIRCRRVRDLPRDDPRCLDEAFVLDGALRRAVATIRANEGKNASHDRCGHVR